MAAGEVAQNQQTAFADPQNTQTPIDADQVTANDNALRGKFNTHDADATIHVQSSDLASRPAAGTAGRKWVTRDAGVVRFFYDTGSDWEEVGYVSTGSAATITGVLTFSTAPVFSNNQAFAADVTVGDDLVVTDAATVGGTLGVTGASTLAAVAATNITASGTLGVTGTSTLGVTNTGALGVTGTATATEFAGSGASLTSLPGAEISGNLSVGSVTSNLGFRQTDGYSSMQRDTSSGGSTALDFAATNYHRHTLTGTGTISFTNKSDGRWMVVEVLQDGTGSRTLSWSGVTWSGGTAPTPSTTANRKDVYLMLCSGTDILGFVLDQNFASTT